MLATGSAVFTGAALLLLKLRVRWLLHTLAYDLAIDLTVTIDVLVIGVAQ
jgi:hypothetical protein